MIGRPAKDVRIAQMRERLAQYVQQHEALELDVVAAAATEATNADAIVKQVREQQAAIERAYEAVKERLDAAELEDD